MICKYYIEMRDGMGQPSQRLLIATEKSMASWVGMKNVVFCSSYNAPTLYLNLLKRSLACRERGTLQTCYKLWSPWSGFPYGIITRGHADKLQKKSCHSHLQYTLLMIHVQNHV